MSKILLCGLAGLTLTALTPLTEDALAQTGLKAATALPSRQVQLNYKKMTWDAYQELLMRIKGSQSAARGEPEPIPDTDCPPAPPKECLDTWKIKTVNPFPDEDN